MNKYQKLLKRLDIKKSLFTNKEGWQSFKQLEDIVTGKKYFRSTLMHKKHLDHWKKLKKERKLINILLNRILNKYNIV